MLGIKIWLYCKQHHSQFWGITSYTINANDAFFPKNLNHSQQLSVLEQQAKEYPQWCVPGWW